VRVVVLEKHADFLRDFRGDTVHPSTLDLIDELSLAAEFAELDQRRSTTVSVVTEDGEFTLADFRRLRGRHRHLTFVPQWDLLDLLARHGAALPGFQLRMQAEVVGVLRDGDLVTGVRYREPTGEVRSVRADLVVAADGRDSATRRAAGLVPTRFGAPMDVLWFRISRRPGDPDAAFGRLARGRLLILIDRGEYWQAGFVIPKGSADRLRGAGLPAFRRTLADLAPFLAGRVEEVADWDAVRLLQVQMSRLRRWWQPGLLCIGDAAHAMSPIGGVGINLAVQDAVATARLLADPLSCGQVTTRHLRRVQRRRTAPTVVTQAIQRIIQRRFLSQLVAGRAGAETPAALRLLARFPALQGGLARFIGIGVLPEHIPLEWRR
jgi:2-polyprenyl-6-methoxyphenol hydroxylase-like FAD-dependent oxidoreductase